ncbi:hypothetical protein BDZ45DRAFT_749107 [Acephala macrosclerotiorum]|nr:hypothetical protein BDZ45DRAFT_749107 [Acephala macrosclerotiorum]
MELMLGSSPPQILASGIFMNSPTSALNKQKGFVLGLDVSVLTMTAIRVLEAKSAEILTKSPGMLGTDNIPGRYGEPLIEEEYRGQRLYQLFRAEQLHVSKIVEMIEVLLSEKWRSEKTRVLSSILGALSEKAIIVAHLIERVRLSLNLKKCGFFANNSPSSRILVR